MLFTILSLFTSAIASSSYNRKNHSCGILTTRLLSQKHFFVHNVVFVSHEFKSSKLSLGLGDQYFFLMLSGFFWCFLSSLSFVVGWKVITSPLRFVAYRLYMLFVFPHFSTLYQFFTFRWINNMYYWNPDTGAFMSLNAF